MKLFKFFIRTLKTIFIIMTIIMSSIGIIMSIIHLKKKFNTSDNKIINPTITPTITSPNLIQSSITPLNLIQSSITDNPQFNTINIKNACLY